MEITEYLASTADGKATAANSECKKLGDRLAALEDGSKRNNIRIEGLPENRESPNPVKFAVELFTKIIRENFKSDTKIAAAYRMRGSNTFRPSSFMVRFERLLCDIGDWRNCLTEEQSKAVDLKFEKHLAGTKIGDLLKYDEYCK
ncbi:ST6B1 Sulfotransferase, partial [Polypterus senegalus]